LLLLQALRLAQNLASDDVRWILFTLDNLTPDNLVFDVITGKVSLIEFDSIIFLDRQVFDDEFDEQEVEDCDLNCLKATLAQLDIQSNHPNIQKPTNNFKKTGNEPFFESLCSKVTSLAASAMLATICSEVLANDGMGEKNKGEKLFYD